MLHLLITTVPSFSISLTASFSFSSFQLAITTLAPRLVSSSEIALPIPVAPPIKEGENEYELNLLSLPVTMATLSLNSPGLNTDIF